MRQYRFDFLSTVHYEATRAGLDPHMVLGLIEVESGFRKYAVSKSGARGYMQVMPFWTKSIGARDQNLFHCAPIYATAAPSCVIIWISRKAICIAHWGVTTAAWASRNIPTW